MSNEAHDNENIVGFVLVGSGSTGFADEFSDIDVVIVLEDSCDVNLVSEEWKEHLSNHLPMLGYGMSHRAENAILHNFYLNNYLEINCCVLPLALLSATKANYKVIWDRTGRMQSLLEITWEQNRKKENLKKCFVEYKSGIWHYVNHAYVALKRNRKWQALSDIEEIRRQAIELHAYRNGLESNRNKDVDGMDDGFRKEIENLLIGDLDLEALKTKLMYATQLFFKESKETSRKLNTHYDLGNLEKKLYDFLAA